MKIHCQTCRKYIGTVADEKIPPSGRFFVTCPLCRQKLAVLAKPKLTPPAIHTDAGEKRQTAAADDPPLPPPVKPESPSAPQPPAEQQQGVTFTPEFSGTAGEYFRIWIVNTFLTIITLGIYSAWAKVRTRRYFYAHTRLAGHPFDYLARPAAILKGNLIIGTGFAAYLISDFFHPGYKAAILAITALLLPLLVYKSLRFYAHNSAFRNIRFRFYGTLNESYISYLLIPLLIPATLGLITPYWVYRRKRYFFNNLAFGTTGSTFTGKASPFYRFHMLAALAVILATGAFYVILGTRIMPALTHAGPLDQQGSLELGKNILAGMIFSYLAFLLFFTFIQQYLFARITNYCWQHARLGKVLFSSTIRVRKLVWIRLTNILAIIFSLGLMAPWAKIRNTRYILGNLAVTVSGSLDEFTAGTGRNESAVGDAAMELFDFEIGL